MHNRRSAKTPRRQSLYPGEKMISAQVHSNWGLKRHLQNSHTIEDLEEFDSLQRQGKVDDEKS